MALKSKLVLLIFLSCAVFSRLSAVEFSDVPSDYWAGPEIERLTALGVLTGYPDRTFKPNGPLNRAELATILVRLKSLEVKRVEVAPFPDVRPQFWGAGYVAAAAKAGLVIGYPDRTFRPTIPLDRVDAIIMVARLEGLPETYDWKVIYKDVTAESWAVRKVFSAKQAGFLDYITGDKFEPLKVFTRGEACWVLARTKLVKAKLKQ
jgi:hypothetical protein